MNEIITKLEALYNRILRLQKAFPSTIPGEEIDRIYPILIVAKDELDKQRPDLFADYNISKISNNLIEAENERRYNKIVLEKLSSDIKYLTDILKPLSGIDIPNLSVTKEGVFFAGQYFDALLKIGEIIATADNEIILIDTYLNEKIIQFIKSKNTKASLTLVTAKKTMTDGFTMFIDAANKQYGKIKVIQNDTFHDRFIIIDKVTIYHFGASLKDAGNKGFMFSVIEENSLKSAFLDKLKTEGI